MLNKYKKALQNEREKDEFNKKFTMRADRNKVDFD
jgi:hypothetical protein